MLQSKEKLNEIYDEVMLIEADVKLLSDKIDSLRKKGVNCYVQTVVTHNNKDKQDLQLVASIIIAGDGK